MAEGFNAVLNSLNMANLTINGRAAKFPDVQRDFMWQLIIPGIRQVAPSAVLDFEDLLVRCRSISIPGRSNEAITSNFMGTRQFFPGKMNPGEGTVTAEFEDTEDGALLRIFYDWSQMIFNTNPDSKRWAGRSMKPVKSNESPLFGGQGYSRNMYLVLLSYMGVPTGKPICFHNAWIQQQSDVSLSYESSGSVKFSVTFQYDYWSLVPDSTAA